MSHRRCWLGIIVYICLKRVSESTSTTTSDFVEIEIGTTPDPHEFGAFWESLSEGTISSYPSDSSDDENPQIGWPYDSVPASLPSGELDHSTFQNVVVIPDIHGDKESFLKSLWIAYRDVEQEFIDFSYFERHIGYFLRGSGRHGPLSDHPDETVMIQLGDVVDRGPHGLECLHILDVLERALGWKLVRLYGNHEFMSHRNKSSMYIHPQEVVSFKTFFKSRDARVSQFGFGSTLWNRISGSSLLMARIGAPSTELNSVSALFVHGGVDTHWADQVIESLDSRGNLSAVDALNAVTHSVVMRQPTPLTIDMYEARLSPVWTRDLAELNQRYVCSKLLPRVLKYFNVARLIVGHTPQHDREMKSLCGSRLILADAMMSRWMLSDGDNAAGNPTALIMKHRDGQLDSLKSIYLEDPVVVRAQVFYHTHLGAQEYKPTSLLRHPVQFSATPLEVAGELRRGMHSITYEFQGFAQEMLGLHKHALMERVKFEKPVRALGVPQITYLSAVGDFSNQHKFFVILDTHGVSLRNVADVTAAIRRQIYEIVLELWKGGYVVDYASAALLGGDPKEVLELFLVDTVTGLIQFVDFNALVERTPATVLETIVGHFAADLSLIPTGIQKEGIDEIRLVREVFEDTGLNVAHVHDNYVLAAEQLPPPSPTTPTSAPPPLTAGAGRIVAPVPLRPVSPPPPPSTPPPLDSLFDILEEEDFFDSPIETDWSITELNFMFHSDSIDVFRGEFAPTSLVQRTRATVVHMPHSVWRVMNALLSGGSSQGFVAKLLATADRMDGSRYFAFDLDPRWVTTLHEARSTKLVREDMQLASDIIEAVSEIHELGVFFNFDPITVKEDIQRRFFVDTDAQRAYLFDFSQLGTVPAGDTEAFDEEIAMVIAALNQIFPGVAIQDTARPALAASDFPTAEPLETTTPATIEAVFAGSL